MKYTAHACYKSFDAVWGYYLRLHAKFASEQEACTWAQRLCDDARVKSVLLKGKLTTPWAGKRATSRLWFCPQEKKAA